MEADEVTADSPVILFKYPDVIYTTAARFCRLVFGLMVRGHRPGDVLIQGQETCSFSDD